MSETPPEEPAHDILAAEAFAVPGPDPTLRDHPIRLPEDPTGIAEPHDILAAEEFAMPAARPAPVASGASAALARGAQASRHPAVRVLVGGALVLLLVRALRRALIAS